MSSDLTAEVQQTPTGMRVLGAEKLDYRFHYISPVFDVSHAKLAETYKPWKRVLIVIDQNVAGIYKETIDKYFAHFSIPVAWKIIKGGEINKNMDTFNDIVDFMDAEGLVRKEPVLVVGGGLVTDVAGYACASYRRSSNFIRVPTTLIGLIDASVSIKVGLNHKKLKNRLGAYHAPMDTYLDFSFLKTLPIGQVRNGTAELIKISTCADKRVWDLLVKHGKDLVENAYGHKEGAEHLLAAAEEIEKKGIDVMLKLESPNLHELGLDRVIAFGHSWSPTLELTPKVPLRHGHAINIDMAYSITLAHKRGLLNEAQRDEYFNLVTSIGLSIDHECFNEELIVIATQAIMKTRDGKQRLAIPDGEFGKCTFLNDITDAELIETLKVHKAFVKERYPGYEGVDAYVDAGDLGEDVKTFLAAKDDGSNEPESMKKNGVNGVKKAAVAAGAVPVDGSGKLTNGETGTIKVAA
ncbi:hypothetical protein QFC22_000112 [Naganishia vaughanmartiniae]|uniref:Uncharacterized protein n=1 Tax=Naganishia vaughanmartiniae TaxID=1424756 RepID=A0ACC2XMT2_9TREE|nr:hypothetical protein QFC22_000112 [Naganishia vaughanmartiniae]